MERALAAFFAMERIERCEIIVVDDGSTDDTPRVLKQLAAKHPGLLAIRQENSGPGAARNTGLAAAGQERILFLDDDVFPAPDLLKAHARFLDKGFDISQGLLDWTPELAKTWIARFMDARGMQFAFDRVADDADLSYLYVYTANLALNKTCVDTHGGFDQYFATKRYAFEDTAFAYTLKQGGCKVGLNRQALALHHHPMTPEGLAAREYKVGYALGVLLEFYPEIAEDLHFSDMGALETLLVHSLGLFFKTPFPRFLTQKTRLRLACKEAFDRGRLDYERQKH